MKVCFTGDLFLGGDLISNRHNQLVISDRYHDADIRISNLEQAIGNTKNRQENKCTLHASSEVLNYAKSLKLDVVALSNNHLQDLGNNGIFEVINQLNEHNIPFFGAGKNIAEAQTPYWINESTCIIGYCESDKPYLKKVQVAKKNTPGVNHLTLKNIIKDLDLLPLGTNAILHFHWGLEHVALPTYDNIELAKKLLKHDKVLCIIGMHAHRIQGIIHHNGKKAYMCLGNFLFPNFYLEPKTHIAYPNHLPKRVKITKDYHFVGKLTYKKWRLKNRISLLVFYNSLTNEITHIPLLQCPNKPTVKEVTGIKKHLILVLVKWLSLFYMLPKPIYVLMQKINTYWIKLYRYSYAFVFLICQNGLQWTIKKTFGFLTNK